MTLQFTDQVVIVTGGAGGLGRAYSTFFASRGAYVLINDFSKEAADGAVKEINAKYGQRTMANYDSVAQGEKLIKQAYEKWGRVDILLNNAGILRDKSFKAMTDSEWDAVQEVHVKGSYACAKAAWPIMRKQKFGRIINVWTLPLLDPYLSSSDLKLLCTFRPLVQRESTRISDRRTTPPRSTPSSPSPGPLLSKEPSTTFSPTSLLPSLPPR
jgi:hypothetical protein